MNTDKRTWLWTLGSAAVFGTVSLYRNLKESATQHLKKEGAFADIRAEALTALNALPDAAPDLPQHKKVKFANGKLLDKEVPEHEGRWLAKEAVAPIRDTYRAKKKAILHEKGADTLSGAWKLDSPAERNGALGFAAVTSVAAGAITYMVSKAAYNTKPRNGADSNYADAGYVDTGGSGFWTSHHGHHDSGGWSFDFSD